MEGRREVGREDGQLQFLRCRRVSDSLIATLNVVPIGADVIACCSLSRLHVRGEQRKLARRLGKHSAWSKSGRGVPIGWASTDFENYRKRLYSWHRLFGLRASKSQISCEGGPNPQNFEPPYLGTGSRYRLRSNGVLHWSSNTKMWRSQSDPGGATLRHCPAP